jgi:hypothetical protein
MGYEGMYYSFETINSGLAIFYWNTGIFEITTDLFTNEDEDNYFSSFVPPKYENKNYPDESYIFLEKN